MRFKVTVQKSVEVEGNVIVSAIKAYDHQSVCKVSEKPRLLEIVIVAGSMGEVVQTLQDLPDEMIEGWKNIETITDLDED